jgi:hypothetical protein
MTRTNDFPFMNASLLGLLKPVDGSRWGGMHIPPACHSTYNRSQRAHSDASNSGPAVA